MHDKIMVWYDNTQFPDGNLNVPAGFLVGINPLNGDVYVVTGEYKNEKNWFDCCQTIPNQCARLENDMDFRVIPTIDDLYAATLHVRDHFDKSLADEMRKFRNNWLKENQPEQYYKYFPKERPEGI